MGHKLSQAHKDAIGQGVRKSYQYWPPNMEGHWPFIVLVGGQHHGFEVRAESAQQAEGILKACLLTIRVNYEEIVRASWKDLDYNYVDLSYFNPSDSFAQLIDLELKLQFQLAFLRKITK